MESSDRFAESEPFVVPEPFMKPDDAAHAGFTDRFFESVLDYLRIDERTRKSFSEIRTHELTDPGGDSTDDRLTVLIVNERVVASVLEWRDDLNFIQVAPAFYRPEHLR